MKFWDSSAIVPLILIEPSSELLTRVLKRDPIMVVWAFSHIEVYSAVIRRLNSIKATQSLIQQCERRFEKIYTSWSAIIDYELVLRRAQRVVSVHGLRSADALQLASALVFFEEKPEKVEFVCLDQLLSRAAAREGFQVLNVK